MAAASTGCTDTAVFESAALGSVEAAGTGSADFAGRTAAADMTERERSVGTAGVAAGNFAECLAAVEFAVADMTEAAGTAESVDFAVAGTAESVDFAAAGIAESAADFAAAGTAESAADFAVVDIAESAAGTVEDFAAAGTVDLIVVEIVVAGIAESVDFAD